MEWRALNTIVALWLSRKARKRREWRVLRVLRRFKLVLQVIFRFRAQFLVQERPDRVGL